MEQLALCIVLRDCLSNFVPQGRTDNKIPACIAKMSVAARSDALVTVKISAACVACNIANVPPCGGIHDPSESGFCSLAGQLVSMQTFQGWESDILGQYCHPRCFIR